MTETDHLTFNLWTEPWIDLERPDGTLERQGIARALAKAHEYRAICSPSPLEVVGIHRLLAAILQDALQPGTPEDLRRLWQAGRFPEGAIERFGEQYAGRFDLFSADQPFLQSGDIPPVPDRKTPVKTVAYLAPDFPSGTGVIHYRHGRDDEQAFCPVCCARGLVVLPAFATSGGAGIKPSINGVPPVYVLPGGKRLFDSLAASLILPEFQPVVRDTAQDLAWWKHPPVVGKSVEVVSAGYLHSLTFPARRVRLHPQVRPAACTRCGAEAAVVVQKMVFEMGESRPKEAPFWQDPFAAYFKREKDAPLPLRPTAGKAAWREFGALFLKHPDIAPVKGKRAAIRPAMIDQLAWLEDCGSGPGDGAITFRCAGMRTDMKAKVFEWIDTGFHVPLALLQSGEAGLDVEDALGFANECERALADVFQTFINQGKKKGERYPHEKAAMLDAYWTALSMPFNNFTATLAEIYTAPFEEQAEHRQKAMTDWYRTVVRTGRNALEQALEETGDDGRALRIRFQCLDEGSKRLYGKLKKKENASYE